jgi:hypothetical protein
LGESVLIGRNYGPPRTARTLVVLDYFSYPLQGLAHILEVSAHALPLEE